MKKLLIVLITATVVLSLPFVSFGGDNTGGNGKTASTVDNRKSKGNGSGTLTIAPSTTSNRGNEGTETSSGSSIPPVTQTSSLNTLGFGTATIDGIMSPGEWDNAIKTDFLANIPGGGTTPATLYIMNDGLNLYFALKVARPSFGYQTQLTVDFDNNNQGVPVQGDDGFQMNASSLTTPLYIDIYLCPCPSGSGDCMIQDVSPNGCILPPGTSDGAGKATNDGTFTIMEVSHLLSSKDTFHDINVKPGSRIGYHVTLTLEEINTAIVPPAPSPLGGPSIVPPPNPPVVAVTQLPPASSGTYYSQLNIVSNIVTRVIDITPGRSVHSINRKSEGKIPVAILSTQDFNAPAQIDRTSLTFGHTGNEESLAFCNEGAEDVNGDGLPDLLCHFKTQAAGFMPDDKFGRLNGKTKDGSAFTATDSVRIVQ